MRMTQAIRLNLTYEDGSAHWQAHLPAVPWPTPLSSTSNAECAVGTEFIFQGYAQMSIFYPLPALSFAGP